jgi:hypothetical protein
MSRTRLSTERASSARPTPSTPVRYLALAVVSLFLAVPASSQVPHPRDVFGFTPGDDYQLADYGQMLEYYDRLDVASDRVQKIEFGHSALGKPMILLFISSEENLAQLDHWQETAEKLARARISEDEARELAANGKAVIWIDGGMHATERAHAQMTSLLAYRVATEESPEMQRIRDDVILLLNPVINPDGLDISTNWYRQNRGTAFETTGPPILYHHYVGHDNNRDWFMILQPETQAVSEMIYHEWYPQIVYNHHQTGPPWARMFIPPFADPVNPHIPAGVITGVNLVGAAMHQRFAEEEKPGVISRVLFSMWWNGGGRTAPYYHNMIGILSETSHSTPTPRYYDPAERPDPLNPYGGRREASVPTSRPSIWYPDPWEGGWSHFRDAVDYMITGSMAVLDIGSRRREQWLYNIYDMGRDAIEAGEAGAPFAYVVPPAQWDPAETVEMINALRRGGIEVHQARSEFQAAGTTYAAGSYVLFTAQAFRPYLMDLMEPQAYPDRRRYAGGPPDPPYDLAGWTLPIQMGVQVDRIDEAFAVRADAVDEARVAAGSVSGSGSWGFALSRRPNASAVAANRLLADGATVHWATGPFTADGQAFEAGTAVIEAGGAAAGSIEGLASDFGLDFTRLASRPDIALEELRTPRIAMYKSWMPNMDEGWTRWVLEQYGFPVDTLHDADLQTVDLSGYDAVILPSQDAGDILNGHAVGTMPEGYTGGVGLEGAAALRSFVEGGGTLVALDHAGDFAIQQFGLPVRNVLADMGDDQFFIPGSLIAIDVDTDHPAAHGMQEEAAAFFVRSSAYEPVALTGMGEGGREELDQQAPEPDVEMFARYAERNLLLSGWAMGEDRFLAGNGAAARAGLGEGEVILLGFRTQFRGQPRGTFKLLFNALQGAARGEARQPVTDQP